MSTVADAAKVLDREYPGWADKIDLNKLNMLVAEKCVLGQLYGGYFSHGALKIRNSVGNSDDLFCDNRYLEVWTAEITARVKPDEPTIPLSEVRALIGSAPHTAARLQDLVNKYDPKQQKVAVEFTVAEMEHYLGNYNNPTVANRFRTALDNLPKT